MSVKPLIMDHPLIQHKISLLRDKNTGSKEFREMIAEITMLMCYEATRDLPTKEVEIETPIAIAKTKVLAGESLFCPYPAGRYRHGRRRIRAGAGGQGSHIGLYRDPRPINRWNTIASCRRISGTEVIVIDPMLATGGSAVDAIQMIKRRGAKNIKFMCIIAAPEGLAALTEAHPDVQIYCRGPG